jgi:pyruvate/2-oxoglutarate dehydrogenase complex dihydrolipoamide acyltransferase (E2) component
MSELDAERGKSYSIEPRNKYFLANLAIAEHEIRPGLTVSFLSEVDLTEVERVRAKVLPGQRKPSYTAFVVKALALAIRDFPYANRRVIRRGVWPFGGPRLQAFTHIDVTVAVERDIAGSESTMFIDIIRDAHKAPLDQMTASLQALATCDVTTNTQWRQFSGLITRLPTWLSTLLIRLPVYSPGHWVQYRGGPALVSSPAKYGVDAVVGTWVHPIGVSFGLVKPRPVAVGMRVEVRPTFTLTLNFDRRVMAGAQAARFFNRMVEILEHADAEMRPYLFPEAPPTREDMTAIDISVLEQ